MGRSWLSIGLLVAGLSLSGAAVGCGDDDDDGAVAGQGGSGGKGGSSGGASGKGGAGGTVSAAECVTKTTAVVKDSFSAECVECGCTANAKAFVACDEEDACWKLLGCIEQACGAADVANPDYLKCAQTEAPAGACKDYASAKNMTAVGAVLLTTCKAKCATEPSDKDAGSDAGN